MAISNEERALFDQAQALIIEQTVFTTPDLVGYALSQIEQFLFAMELDAPICDEFSIAIQYELPDLLSEYKKGGISEDEFFYELDRIPNRISDRYSNFHTRIASDGTFVFEGPDYSTGYPLNTVNIRYISSLGTAPTQKTKTSYLYTEYTLTANDLLAPEGNTNATFKGWTLADGTPVSVGDMVSGDVTLVAEWEVPTVDYTISYETAYGTAPASKTVTVNEGEHYVLTADDLPTLTADGYTFKGWTANGTAVSVGDTISADSTLTAVWEEVVKTQHLDLYIPVGNTWVKKDLHNNVMGEAQTYLYNGVELPALPEWDKETYPYAIVFHDYFAVQYWVYFTNMPVTCTTDDFYFSFIIPLGCSFVSYRCRSADGLKEWLYRNEVTENTVQYRNDLLQKLWTSHDVIDVVTNTVYLAASDPVPVGGAEWKKKQVKEAYKQVGGEWVKIAPEPDPEPIAYLYNGVQLPDIDEVWTDKEKHPYAFIVLRQDATQTVIRLCLTNAISSVSDFDSSNYPTIHYRIDFVAPFADYYYDDLAWKLGISNSGNEGEYFEYATSVIWSNVDIYHDNGNLLSAASEPVPVYE